MVVAGVDTCGNNVGGRIIVSGVNVRYISLYKWLYQRYKLHFHCICVGGVHGGSGTKNMATL